MGSAVEMGALAVSVGMAAGMMVREVVQAAARAAAMVKVTQAGSGAMDSLGAAKEAV